MTSQHPSGKQQNGFSLIELIIAMTIGFFLTGVVAALYFNVRTSFRYQEDLARLQETGRFTVERLGREIRMAGYNGCGSLTDLSNVVNGGATGPFLDFATPIIGYEGGVSTFPTQLTNAITGSGAPDIFVVLGVDTSSELIVKGHNPPSAQIDTNQHSIKPDEILMITDCSHTAIFQMTGPTNNNNNATNVVHNTGTGTPGNCTKYLGASCPASKTYTFKPGSSMLKVYSNAYFIAPSCLNPSGRSLWVRPIASATSTLSCSCTTSTSPCSEVMEGVQDMQITYGQDTNGDKSADKFVTADVIGTSTSEWAKVVSARVSLLVKSSKDNIATKPQTYSFNGTSTTATDKSLFKVFTETVTLRNRAP